MTVGETTITAVRRRKARSILRKPLRDAVLAAALFAVGSSAFVCDPTAASPNGPAAVAAPKSVQSLVSQAVASDEPAALVQIATASSAAGPDTIYKHTSASAAWSLMAFAFSVLAALNLALVRHLRRAYVHPARRGQARRQPSGKVLQR